jgi:PadR family transcriptional regulator PadR
MPLGEFELLVMLALLHLGDRAYGRTVRDEIVGRTGRETSFGTVYTTLARLESKELLRSTLGDPTPERGGRRKKFFQLTPSGQRTVAATLHTLRSMTRGLDIRWQTP